MDAIPCFCVGVIVVIVFGVWSVWLDKKRGQQLRRVAKQLGFAYAENGDQLLQTDLAGLPLFTRGYLRRVRHVLNGQIGAHQIYLFEYRYRYRTGRRSSTRTQTVVAAWLSGFALPTFRLRPEGLFDRVAEALGLEDLDFPDYPRFSSQNHLTAADSRAVYELFTPRLLQFFEVNRRLIVEGAHEWIAIYRFGRRIRPDLTRELLEESSQIVAAIISARE